MSDASVEHSLRLLHPRMLHLVNLERRRDMAMALRVRLSLFSVLQELAANCDDLSFLSEEQKELLQEHDSIFAEAHKETLADSSLSALYEDLFLDYVKLGGGDGRSRVPALHQLLLHDYSLDNMIAFYRAK